MLAMSSSRRAGRAGARGVVVSLVEPSEEFVMERLGRKLGITIPMAQLAAGRVEVVERNRSDGGEEERGEGGGRTRRASRPSVRVLGNPPATS
jgi:superfamily II DNA/RNA helicase